MIIIGHFNFHMDDTADRYGAQFAVYWNCLTGNIMWHILDLVISRKGAEALKIDELVVTEQLISEHKTICFQLNLQKPLNEQKSVVSRRLRNFDFEVFNKKIIL